MSYNTIKLIGLTKTHYYVIQENVTHAYTKIRSMGISIHTTEIGYNIFDLVKCKDDISHHLVIEELYPMLQFVGDRINEADRKIIKNYILEKSA